MNTLLAERTYEDIREKMSSEMPKGYERLKVNDAEKVALDTFMKQIRSTPAPVWRIHKKTKRYCARKPIYVRIYQDGEFFFAENETLAVCGSGNSPQEALQDFGMHILHFFDYYRKLDEVRLMGDAVRLKKIYADLFFEE